MDDALAFEALLRQLPAGSVAAYRGPGDGARMHVSGPAEPLPVFSVTKMFVAAGVLRAVDAGLLGLADPLASRLPGAPTGCTIAQVLTHTAGLGDYTAHPGYLRAVRDDPGEPWDLEAITAASTPGVPGAFAYGNTGYWHLGAMLEEVTAMSLGQYLHREIFEPADMASTRYPEPETSLTVSGYSTLWAGPAGAAFSTPADLLAFGDLFSDANPLFPSALSPAMRAAFLDSVPVKAPAPWREPRYGAGVMIDPRLRLWGHGGAGPGYCGAVFTSLATGAAAALICPGPTDFSPESALVSLLGLPG
ncbi:serine hydrolase domain-containing protein [Paeniglutamicibacter sp. MACA_103]|uniref:serine hydrolase domain-containing protein n=1 Tax=Paeniglutamicibacter sp. MACA_103 TaxID=3377337 RepID=UPI003893712E